MRFEPKTEQDIERQHLLPDGDYDFEVVGAIEKPSKSSGNEMIQLKLKVFTNAIDVTIFDYLLESMAFKLRHFAEATGLLVSYNKGILTAFDCQGRTGYLRLTTQEGQNGYKAKNVVDDYIVKQRDVKATHDQPIVAGGIPAGDDVPF
jgi:hypothetical protein